MKLHDNQKGFTLIEALVAIAIFSIGFLAVAAMQTGALSSTTSSRKMTEALEVASSHAELLQSLPFYPDFRTASGNAKFNNTPPALASGTHVDSDDTGNYTIQWEVTDDEPLEELADNRWVEGGAPVTISKTITIEVFETRNPGRIRAQIHLAKVWERE